MFRRCAGPALTVFLALALLFTREGHTSGGGEITITRKELRLELATPRKITRGGEMTDRWVAHVEAWRKANEPLATRVALAIERVIPRHRKRMKFVASKFDAPDAPDDAKGWPLTVDVPVFEVDSGNTATATFVFRTQPAPSAVAAFTRDVRAATIKAVGKKPATAPEPD